MLRSLEGNNLTNDGNDMSGMLKLAEALPQSKLESLKCATAPACARVSSVQGPLNTLTVSVPFLVAACTDATLALKEARRLRKLCQNHR